MLTISMLISQVRYDGPKQFHIADGGSPQEDIDYYKLLTKDFPTTVEVTDNLSDMVNSCAHHGGDLWLTVLDDFVPRRKINITPDARLLLEHPEIGCVRMARLAFHGNGDGTAEENADLINCGGLHWWRLNKSLSKNNYMCSLGFHMYHRRFWDAYGDIPACLPKEPGNAELNGMGRFWRHKEDAPTIAIPMRFGQDCEDWDEPIWHLGTWRTDDYRTYAGSRL
jgi:hypothetical protein